MSGEQLIDLDELVLRCKDDQAKKYIREAVSCYKAGAFRASIVATWTAVVFDFLHKLRELSLSGDPKAAEILTEFEKTHDSNDYAKAMAFEGEVLNYCEKELGFISKLERLDLERLKQDRNRCAHPSMVSTEEAYQPSPELVRTHLRNAVTHMLQQPPLQGKAALGRLITHLNSNYFPTNPVTASESLSGILGKPRESLVKNFAIVILKDILSAKLDKIRFSKHLAALQAIHELYREYTENVFSNKLNSLVIALEDTALSNAILLIKAISGSWYHLQGTAQIKLEGYIRGLPNADILLIHTALATEHFYKAAIDRLKLATSSELEMLSQEPREEYLKRIIEIFKNSKNIDELNILSVAIKNFSEYLKEEDVIQIFEASKGSEIKRSRQLIPLLEFIQTLEIIPNDLFDKKLEESGLLITFYPSGVDDIPF